MVASSLRSARTRRWRHKEKIKRVFADQKKRPKDEVAASTTCAGSLILLGEVANPSRGNRESWFSTSVTTLQHEALLLTVHLCIAPCMRAREYHNKRFPFAYCLSSKPTFAHKCTQETKCVSTVRSRPPDQRCMLEPPHPLLDLSTL
ncbi:unnamed protein product [Mesocestoides corti]|uniref:Uncharacterized protein n=1 Tax=Mesocestoides corti TaxID=53468 RepID=A0A0R3UE93_MESCO|nr:unnamed protein product [Mesocestoides corti]